MENCTTDAECEALDNCGRYKCDTGTGECYLPWDSAPCGSLVRGGGVGRGYRKLTNRKNINNMRGGRGLRGRSSLGYRNMAGQYQEHRGYMNASGKMGMGTSVGLMGVVMIFGMLYLLNRYVEAQPIKA